jgi:deoxyribonucleoside regulator
MVSKGSSMKKRVRENSASEKVAVGDPDQLILDVAVYYYEQKLTQEEIGKRINVSRSTVSRLLDEARDRGIVQIKVNYPWQRAHDLEQRLISEFGLVDARVLVSKDKTSEEVLKGAGVLAARLLDDSVKDGHVVGLSYGRSVASTIVSLMPTRQLSMTAVQIIGAPGSDDRLIDGSDLVRRFAQAYGCTYRYLPVPLLVEDIRTRDALIQLPQVYETLNLARKANLVLSGIGALAPKISSGIWDGYLNQRELHRLEKHGAVGHMCCQFFDSEGQLLDIEVNDRSIGVGIKALTNVESAIGVATGEGKAASILGALRGRYLNILVTDDAAANAILNLHRSRNGKRP